MRGGGEVEANGGLSPPSRILDHEAPFGLAESTTQPITMTSAGYSRVPSYIFSRRSRWK
jgi:hypothetical protein